VFRVSRSRHGISPLLARSLVVALIAGTAAIAVHPAGSTTGTIYIDSGGSGGNDPDGHSWAADYGFTGGTVSTTSANISGTTYQSIFRSERSGLSDYHVTVPNGTYWVKLLESEHTYTAKGKRVFDVTSEGALVEDNLDVFARAGGINKAIYVVFKTTVSDAKLNLGFKASAGTPIIDGLVIEPTTSSTPSTPSGGSVMWGMDDSSSFSSTQSGLGRQFALVREYRRLDQSFTNAHMTSLTNAGQSLVLSVRSQWGSGYLKYATITSGKYDSTFLKGFAALNALKTKTFFIFQHEPDSTSAKASCSSSTSDSVCGPQFVAAWKHVYNLAKSHGYTRLIFAWTITSYGFNPQTHVRNNYYWPGTAYTDWIGVDAYNGGCNQSWYGSFYDMMNYSVTWIQQHAPTKNIILPEYGATEGSTAGAKANWFNAIPSALTKKGYTTIKGLVYWNESPGSKCSFKINTSSSSYNAYKSLGLSAQMQMKAPT
jgi:hypothetical protein